MSANICKKDQGIPYWLVIITTAVLFSFISIACADRYHVQKEITNKGITESIPDRLSDLNVENKVNNNTQEYWYNLGISYTNEGKYKKAKQTFKRAIRINPDSAESHYRLGLAYKKLDDITHSLRAMERAVTIKPDFADAHFNLGMIYQKIGREKDALDAYRSAVSIDQNNADYYYHLGNMYLQTNLRKEAKKAFQRATALKPDFAKAHYALGKVYVRFNDIDSAFNEYKILVDLDSELANKLFDKIYK